MNSFLFFCPTDRPTFTRGRAMANETFCWDGLMRVSKCESLAYSCRKRVNNIITIVWYWGVIIKRCCCFLAILNKLFVNFKADIHLSLYQYGLPRCTAWHRHDGGRIDQYGNIIRAAGFNVSWSVMFSCIKMFGVVSCIEMFGVVLRLLQLKTEGQTI